MIIASTEDLEAWSVQSGPDSVELLGEVWVAANDFGWVAHIEPDLCDSRRLTKPVPERRSRRIQDVQSPIDAVEQHPLPVDGALEDTGRPWRGDRRDRTHVDRPTRRLRTRS